MVEKNNASLSVKRQCNLLEMARSTYYRPRKPESELNLLLMRRMDELHTENPTWGSRKLRDKLRDVLCTKTSQKDEMSGGMLF